MVEHGEASTLRLAFLIAVFFCSMTVNETILEAASRSVAKASDSTAMASVITLGQFIGCVFLALLCGGARAAESSGPKPTGLKERIGEWLPWFGVSLLIWNSAGLSNMAVSWVNYPVKVVFKSSKLIPTMIFSVCMGNSKPYTMTQYFAGVLICVGTAGFTLHQGRAGMASEYVVLGIGFLVVSVFSDALAINRQQQMMQRTGTPPMTVMLWVNWCGAIISVVIMVCSGQFWNSIDLVTRQPETLRYVGGTALCLSMGVWAYTHLIKEAGAVIVVVTATLRKVVTLLLSYLIFPKTLSNVHIWSGFIVIAGIVVAEMSSRSASPKELKQLKQPKGDKKNAAGV